MYMSDGTGEIRRGKRRVLVVDDEEGIRALFKAALHTEDVVACESAETALEVLKEGRFDVMILDINLPGMNGCELCTDIRDDHPDTYIIGITGSANKFEFAVCRAAGFDAYFYKPINIKLIRDIIEKHVNRPLP